MNTYGELQLNISTDGPGIVLYSDKAIKCSEGEDFFSKEFNTPEKVAEHLKKGDIIGFNTGGPGQFVLKIREGYPSEQTISDYLTAIRLALEVIGGKVNIIDVYWLSEWSDEVPDEQTVAMEDGFYYVTVLTKKPSSGIYGDNQEILLYFKLIEEMPILTWTGIPQLF
ncbi:hypothetical protein D6853_01210 [Butyrivibrio sp. X503]|uniref:hypothetical protein n=1 Tax=Butyrivibrio sp. X503 TaxID=2364878 RepID=UPI000EAAAB28|nr:hypothetical protein [Butyrivibrio sp. X503]RKM58186.1 hypothetical protein D6853_01210 [Butyrivibrio sp. X503]